MKKMTKAEMRVAICKDVIKQVRAGTFTASTQGNYFVGEICEKGIDLDKDESAKPYMKKIKACNVCAKGGLMWSYINKFNNINLNEIANYKARSSGSRWSGTSDYSFRDDPVGYNKNRLRVRIGSEQIMQKLTPIFTVHQLNLIEAVYEGWRRTLGNSPFNVNPNKYICPSLNHEDRLIAIMKNMIANGGLLKPDPKLKNVDSFSYV